MARMLTTGEKAFARTIFGDALALDHIEVRRRRWFPFQPRDIAMTPMGHMHFHPQGSLYREDFSREGPGLLGLFIHELAHVWQTQHGGRFFLPLIRHPFCRYPYTFVPGKPFLSYGIEQQAEIVRHAFLLRQGVPVSGKPPLAEYQAILPFRMG
jgi:hypothetical protein